MRYRYLSDEGSLLQTFFTGLQIYELKSQKKISFSSQHTQNWFDIWIFKQPFVYQKFMIEKTVLRLSDSAPSVN